MTNALAWVSVAGTIALTIYGQLMIKWRLGGVALPSSLGGKIELLGRELADPWVVSAFAAAFVASLFWMAAMTKLPLSAAYPFTSLSFVLVTFLSVVYMHEPLTLAKIAGVSLVVGGLVLIARG